MLGRRDRDGSVMNSMKDFSSSIQDSSTPFGEKRMEREKESKVTKIVKEVRGRNKTVSGPASQTFSSADFVKK